MNYSNIYQPNPLSERFLKWIHQKQRNSQLEWEGKPCISIEDAMLCCRLSQCYQEVVLAKLHSRNNRVLVMARCLRADQQLRQAISSIPALSGHELKDGDPGLYILRSRTVNSADEVELPNPDYVVLDSRDEMDVLFRATSRYSFYKRYRKNLSTEFIEAEKDLRKLVERYRLPGCFSWNSPIGAVRLKREKVPIDFMEDYIIRAQSLRPDANVPLHQLQIFEKP